MARFSNTAPLARRGPTSLGPNPTRIRTFEGAVGFEGDAHVELFNAAVSGLLADNFYENADARIARLIAAVPKCDPAWLQEFIPWLRVVANLRSAPVVLAAEYVRAGFPNGRALIAKTLKRADEPAELIGYWFSRYGRNLPQPVKRGIADAVGRLYNETALLRYDGTSRSFRFGDVIELVHPKPSAEWQGDLFKFALDRRRHSPVAHPGKLPKVSKTLMVENLPSESRTAAKLRELLDDRDVVFSWERAAGWLNGPMDGYAWESLIPTMGYFALLRNLNNFERQGISSKAVKTVIERITNPEAIASSGVMPFRFLTAYKNMTGDRYKQALSDAAELAVRNLPFFDGKTQIMVDCSGSMANSVGQGRSSNPLKLTELAGFFAESIARQCADAEITTYSGQIRGVHHVDRGVPVLRACVDRGYAPMGSTSTWMATEQAVRGRKFDRVIILTDEQSFDQDGGSIKIPVITWNLAGYNAHHTAHGKPNRHFVGGYSDTTLQTLPSVLARGATGRWPWEIA